MKKIIASALIIGLLSACSKKNQEDPAPAASSDVSSNAAQASLPAVVPQSAAPNLTQTPDVGKLEQVAVNATGSGITPGAAINDALKTAIMQVNGTTVNASSANVNLFAQATASLDVETADGTDSAKATAVVEGQGFADSIVTQSKGVVSSFKVVKVTFPGTKGGMIVADIEAKIAKFVAPADSGKIKVVVAPLHANRTAFNIGGRMVPAQEVLATLHQQIVDALSQTGRFTVLDRQFEGDLQNELDMIDSGKTTNTDFAKLGQALSADLVWVGVINDFAYNKNVRHLQTSDRDLVSFSGGWSMSQRMINLTTRQILQSSTLQGAAPSIGATTLGSGFNEVSTLKNMEADIVKKTSEAILLRTFPVSVVERDGSNVVLSQGGSAVALNARYMVYLQGKEIKDPQTGQSLGTMESLCCEVVVNRVTPNWMACRMAHCSCVKRRRMSLNPLRLRQPAQARVATRLNPSMLRQSTAQMMA